MFIYIYIYTYDNGFGLYNIYIREVYHQRLSPVWRSTTKIL